MLESNLDLILAEMEKKRGVGGEPSTSFKSSSGGAGVGPPPLADMAAATTNQEEQDMDREPAE